MVSGRINFIFLQINIQVDFERVRLVSAVATQGRQQNPLINAQWVTEYRVLYSIDCVTFIPYKSADGLAKVIG